MLIATALLAGPRTISAQTANTSTSASTASSDVAAKREALQNQLNQINDQIAATQSTLNTLGSQHKSLQNDIDTLTAQIKKSQLQLQATQVQITALQNNIVIHSNTINVLSGKLSNEQQTLGQIIRNTNEVDNYSLVEVVLSADSVSDFFSDLDTYTAIKQEIGTSYDQTVDTRNETETEKSQLEDQETQQQQLEDLEQQEKAQIQSQEAQKQKLLSQTKSQEASYQGVLAVQQKTKSQIEQELFALAGGSGQISLPTAITLAKEAGASTGVEPAFILGILKQETNIGANVGQCLVTNSPSKGDGIKKTTGAAVSGVMKPSRDVDPFMAITAALGIDPASQVVSCPQGSGYGGAMGPAQFIPSTWQLYAKRIEKATGHSVANPWDNLDAFTAIAIYMADLGATDHSAAAEREAALRYYAGSGWANPAYAFYGDSVMGFTAQFQSDIDTLGS